MPNNKWKYAKNLFALIIGIDEYKHVSRLSWAVSDAVAMESFVHKDLGVPKHRIKTLLNKGATRKRILEAFDDLRQNEGIKENDPILIFFAGHGCAIKSVQLQGWRAGDRKEIQAICPQNVKVQGTPNREESPIPDFVLTSLINKLSRKRGNNITVIFDCCHAASGTREVGVRCVTFHGKLPPDIDDDFGVMDDTRGQFIPLGFLNQCSRSHVLLAACGANEKAREESGHGLFTRALLETFRIPRIDKLSFIEFMKQMPHVKGQTVQCEGHFKNHILFSTRIRELSSHFFPVEKGANRLYKIEAGSVHGVTRDSLFDVFKKASPNFSNNKRLGRLRVEGIYPFHAEAVLEGDGRGEIVSPAFALQVRGGTALYVYFSRHLLKEVRLDDLLNMLNDDVVYVKRKEEADFIVRLSSKSRKAVFITTLDDVRKHGHEGHLPCDIEAKAEPISRVLLAACRWKQHLYSRPNRSLWSDNVHIEFFRLQMVEDDGFPLERNNASKLNDGNKVVIEVAPNDRYGLYGLEIKNRSTKELYLSLLVFNIDDLSIHLHNGGPLGTQSDGGADPSLPPKSSLQIGCGDGGALPFAYELRDTDVDVTILKLYLTTKPEPLEWLQQETPFNSKVRHQLTAEELKSRYKSPDQWDTILFTVEQRRHSKRFHTPRISRDAVGIPDSGPTFEYLILTFSGLGVVWIFGLFLLYLSSLSLG